MNIKCNCCGKELRKENDIFLEEVIVFEKNWGYFSKKDGEYHTFCLCEECYDKITATFQIPVTVSDRTELI